MSEYGVSSEYTLIHVEKPITHFDNRGLTERRHLTCFTANGHNVSKTSGPSSKLSFQFH